MRPTSKVRGITLRIALPVTRASLSSVKRVGLTEANASPPLQATPPLGRGGVGDAGWIGFLRSDKRQFSEAISEHISAERAPVIQRLPLALAVPGMRHEENVVQRGSP